MSTFAALLLSGLFAMSTATAVRMPIGDPFAPGPERAEVAAIFTGEMPSGQVLFAVITNEYDRGRVVRQSLCPKLIQVLPKLGQSVVSWRARLS